MGRKVKSWDEVAPSGKANFLDSWTKEGQLEIVLHREMPTERAVHNFRRIAEKDGKKFVAWYPFVCWESDDFRRRQRFEKDNPPQAELCPACRLVDFLRSRDDLPDDKEIFAFDGDAKGDDRSIRKVDILGERKGKDAFQDDFSAKTDYVIPVIPYNEPGKGVCLTTAKWSLGRELRLRIQKDIERYGVDQGDPSIKPTAYIFEYDKETKKYSVQGFDRAHITDEMVELWGSEAPDPSAYTKPGNPRRLKETMQEAAKIKLPLDDIFAPSLKLWKDEGEEEFAPEAVEQNSRATKKPAKAANEPPAKSKVRSIKKSEPEPEPEPEEKDEEECLPCENCGKDWPLSVSKCPNCGAVADDESEEEEPQPPKKANASNSKKPKQMPW